MPTEPKSVKAKVRKQQIRRRIAQNRNSAIRQIKGTISKERVLNQAIGHFLKYGYIDREDVSGVSKNVKSAAFLNACGVDVSLAGLGADYRRKDFSLLKEESGTEILRNITRNTAQYQDLRKIKKPLDIKRVSLTDAIRTLDQQKTLAERRREKIRNYSTNNDFTHLATILAARNSKTFPSKLKHFKTYEFGKDPRHSITTDACERNVVVNGKINDQGVN